MGLSAPALRCFRTEKEALTSRDAQVAWAPGAVGWGGSGVAQGHRGQGRDSTFVAIDCRGPEGGPSGQGRAPPHTHTHTPGLNSFGERKNTHKTAPLPPHSDAAGDRAWVRGRVHFHAFAYPAAHSCIRLWAINSWQGAPGGERTPRGAGVLSARVYCRPGRLRVLTPP